MKVYLLGITFFICGHRFPLGLERAFVDCWALEEKSRLHLAMSITYNHLRKARRSAIRATIRAPCVACTAYGKTCSDFRPCKTCVKKSRSCYNLEQRRSYVLSEQDWSSSQQTVPEIERPLKHNSLVSIKANSLPVPALPSQIEWAGTQITKFLALGHQVTFLSEFFFSLSANDCTVLDLAMNTAAVLAEKVKSRQIDEREAAAMFQGGYSRLKDALPLCDEETGNAAVVCTGYDPSSRSRRSIVANARRAAFFNMHREEMLARAAACELQPPFIEWDVLLQCLYMSVAEHFKLGRGGEIYQRMYLGGRGQRRAQLVSGRMEEIKDGLDRVIEVRPPPSARSFFWS